MNVIDNIYCIRFVVEVSVSFCVDYITLLHLVLILPRISIQLAASGLGDQVNIFHLNIHTYIVIVKLYSQKDSIDRS